MITNEDSNQNSSVAHDDIQMALSKNVQNLIDRRNRQIGERTDVTPEKLQMKFYEQRVVPFPASSLVTVNENENQDSASEHSHARRIQRNQRQAGTKYTTMHNIQGSPYMQLVHLLRNN